MSPAVSSDLRIRGNSGGFSIVTAIFLLVVLAALGAAIVIVSTTQQIGSALDVQGARVYQAARAGIEWGAYKVRRDSGYASNIPTQTVNQLTGSACTSTDPLNPTISSFAPTAPTMAGIVVTVKCYAIHDNTNMGPWVYSIESTSCNQPNTGWGASSTACPNSSPGANYIERRMKVTL